MSRNAANRGVVNLKERASIRVSHISYNELHKNRYAKAFERTRLFLAHRVIAMLQRNGSFHRQRTSSACEGEMARCLLLFICRRRTALRLPDNAT
ncbi:MAG: hypothetical protein ABUJ98_14795 [Hyphomicrobium sp.]